jgi:hypothetical protein
MTMYTHSIAAVCLALLLAKAEPMDIRISRSLKLDGKLFDLGTEAGMTQTLSQLYALGFRFKVSGLQVYQVF